MCAQKSRVKKNKQELNMRLVEETERSHLLLIDSICIFVEMRKTSDSSEF